MEEEWRIYLKEHAPELYQSMLVSISWAAEWRDKRIKKLLNSVEEMKCCANCEHYDINDCGKNGRDGQYAGLEHCPKWDTRRPTETRGE